MLIKLWDWDKGWACSQVFEGHSHYVMAVCWNPKDTNTFASASLDRTLKARARARARAREREPDSRALHPRRCGGG